MNKLLKLAIHLRNLTSDPATRARQRGTVIGKRIKILEDVRIDASHGWHIEIGDDVTLAPRVHILAHDASSKCHLHYTRIGKVRIGNRVFIGAGAIILPGVAIGDDVVVGAGSIVTRDIPSNSVAVGNPARVVCSMQEFLQRRQEELQKYPRFGEEYTRRKHVTKAMQQEMNDAMVDRFAFIT